MISVPEKAYAAGVFDGGGYIGLSLSGRCTIVEELRILNKRGV